MCCIWPGMEAIGTGASRLSLTNSGAIRSVGRTSVSRTSARSAAVRRRRRGRCCGKAHATGHSRRPGCRQRERRPPRGRRSRVRGAPGDVRRWSLRTPSFSVVVTVTASAFLACRKPRIARIEQRDAGCDHEVPGPQGDRRHGPPAVRVQEDRAERLTLEQGVGLALQLGRHVGVQALFACRGARLRVRRALVHLGEVAPDVAGERLCLGAVDDLLAREVADVRLLLRRHRLVRRERDVLRLQPIRDVVPPEVASVDGRGADHDQRDRDHEAHRADQPVPTLPIHRVPPSWGGSAGALPMR